MATTQQDKILAAALRRLEMINRQDAFDPYNLESRPTAKQLEVIADFGTVRQQWIRAGNQSGKSQTCARIVSWFLTGTHPNWKKPEEWRDEPLLVIIAGRTGKQIEDSLLPKIKGFLEPGTYKEVRIGNIIQRLELENGDRIIFQSLENPNTARERLQSYVAHLVWVDELPPTIDIVRELLVRVQARNGYFLASFTPTVVNTDIQKHVDSLTLPEGKVYRFHMLDNPLYEDPERKAQLLSRYANMPIHMQEAIFRGEWVQVEDQVYYFDYSSMVEVPKDYSPLWRHIESVDPASSSKLGLTVWAECPITGIWYCILSDYLHIPVPTDLITEVARRTKNFNIVRRVSDSHETWYIQQAAAMGIHYTPIYKKDGRKTELIKQLQEFLGIRVRLAPHCQELIAELQECRWSDRADNKIINASRFHLLDSAQYFCDNIPIAEKKVVMKNWHTWLLDEHNKRLAQEDKIHRTEEKKAEAVRLRIQKRQGIIGRGGRTAWR